MIAQQLALCYMRIVEEFDVASDNPKFTSIDGVLYDKDVTRLLKVPADYD